MKYAFITQHKNTWPVYLQCQVLGVTRSGYYRWQALEDSRQPDSEHEEMLGWVKDLAASSKYSYGSRRMKAALNALGCPVSRNKARKLMREAGVQVRHRKKYKVTTDSNHKQPVFDNLLDRQFDVSQPDQVYASDITYLWTREGWLYLAVVIDLYSRKVVGWSMSTRMKAQLVCDALTMAIWRRKPKPGLIHHSDRGSQYASKAFRRLLDTHGIQGSMSRKGNWTTILKIVAVDQLPDPPGSSAGCAGLHHDVLQQPAIALVSGLRQSQRIQKAITGIGRCGLTGVSENP